MKMSRLLKFPHFAAAVVALCAVIALSGCQTVPQKGLSTAQVAVLKQEGFIPSDSGWELGISSKLLFGNNIATLSNDSRQRVDNIGHALSSVGIEALRVDGHTDNQGEHDYNQQLSLQRANAVADELVAAGITRNTVSVRGMGDSVPVASNRTVAGRAQNRRVSIIVTQN
jgi:outer membrane protein OmpA-like peptidoglycan-associated protein